jgi:hypothetical protein
MYYQNNQKSNKKKKNRITDKRNNKSMDNNFWEDIDMNDDINDFEGITDFSFLKKNEDTNSKKEKEKEKEDIDIFTIKYKNIIKDIFPVENKYRNTNLNLNSDINDKSKQKNKYNKRSNSVDSSQNKDNLKKTKHNKIADNLSVFKRNQKWLETKNKKLNKEIEKFINKKEEEIKQKTSQNKVTNDINVDDIFNEEDNVTSRPENYRFFMRLIQGRQERERLYYLNNNPYAKVNLLKKSHYTARQNMNISQKEMNKYKKYIHNELKGTSN